MYQHSLGLYAWFANDGQVDVGFTYDYGCVFRVDNIKVVQILKTKVANRSKYFAFLQIHIMN